jgi:hypothetical protein
VGKDMKIGLKGVTFLLVLGLLGCVGLGIAAYTMTSNSVLVNVSSQATINLAVDKASITQGDAILLTATVSDGGVSSGLTVTFLDGAAAIGTATTNTAGVATLSLNPTVGAHTYTATASHN